MGRDLTRRCLDRIRPLPSTGSFSAFLALTFSTLLSSQASGAHRSGASNSGLGQLDLLYGLCETESTRHPLVPHLRREDPPAPGELLRAHACPDHLVDLWGPPGRPPQTLRSPASCTPLRLDEDYALVSRGSNAEGGVGDHARHAGLRLARQGRVMVTAPTVRLPRRRTA
jgi:hypothetical protein